MKNIIFEDEDILIIKKLAGIPVQTGRIGKRDLESDVRNYLAEKNSEFNPYVAIINRLDQPVEGIVIFAKNEDAAKSLSNKMNDKQINKEYLALVSSNETSIEKYEGKITTLTNYLLKLPKENIARVVKDGLRGSKKSVLSFEVVNNYMSYKDTLGEKRVRLIADNDNVFLLKIQLETGRFHQIRAQLSNINMPIVGDVKYGDNSDAEIFKRGEIGLIAYKIEFEHPKTEERMMFQILDN